VYALGRGKNPKYGCLRSIKEKKGMNTDELIHEAFLLWDEEQTSCELTDEEVFTAGAKFIINYLINNGKL